MIGKRSLLWTCLLAAVVIPQALGQEEPGESTQPLPRGQITRTVYLNKVSAERVAEEIDRLQLPVSAEAGELNWLVLTGSPQYVQRLADEYIPLLDVTVTDESYLNDVITRFIPIHHCQTQALMPLLQTVAPHPSTQIALDSINRMLVVRALQSEIKAIYELLLKVDRPTRAMTLHFYFLRAGIGGSKVGGKLVLPEALEPIATTLEESGFENPSLIAPVIVVADQGREFKSESLLRPTNDRGVVEDELRILVRGVAQTQVNQDYFQLDLQASLQGVYADPEGKGRTPSVFDVQTSIGGKLGEYVILAASPSSTVHGNAVALAVMVTRN